MSLQSFFAMGGYAAYVWPAYAVFFVVLIADYLAPIRRRRRLLRELHARMARQKARENRRTSDAMDTARQQP
ncbi:MAG TPA: heme exporter protein CcmD [Oleiagrimonas sp.]|nr:heme exporter protein CcmD [Oleiagrimonas sp.]